MTRIGHQAAHFVLDRRQLGDGQVGQVLLEGGKLIILANAVIWYINRSTLFVIDSIYGDTKAIAPSPARIDHGLSI